MKRRYLLIALGVALLLFVAGWYLYRVHEQRFLQREEEARLAAIREEEEKEIILAYIRFHYAIGRLGSRPELNRVLDVAENGGANLPFSEFAFMLLGDNGEYLQLRAEPEYWSDFHPYGIGGYTYAALRMYYHRTGFYLSWEMLVDYLSEEFEEDGTRRLYNNGNHPEVDGFVTWMWEGQRGQELLRYWDEELRSIYDYYLLEHEGSDFEELLFRYLSPQMIDALARAEADPDYELDLTSLQKAGY